MAVPQGFPNITTPVVSSDGNIQYSWLQFLISLWNRTGGSQGNILFNPGDIKESAVSGAQPGWLECDGSAVARNEYPNLFQAIGITYGAGDGTSTFTLPDYRGRFRIGTNATYPLGQSGGSPTGSLVEVNLPPHNHPVIDPGHIHTVTDPGHSHTITDPGHDHPITDPGHSHTAAVVASTGTTGTNGVGAANGNTGTSTTAITVDSHITNITQTDIDPTNITQVNSNLTGVLTGDTGSGTPFAIIPPYLPATVLIKT